MFTAVIIACHVASADMCMQITDSRGPYDTAERCEVRIEEMIKDLTLKFNKARQAAITTEMLEIVGGAEALKG